MDKIHELPAHVLRRMIKKREVSIEEVIAAQFDRIEKVEGKIKAFLSLYKEEALQEAQNWDRKIKESNGNDVPPLCGIPVAIKDNICFEDKSTTCASRILGNFHPPYSATVVKKLQKAGCIIVGKTNMDEFAMGSSTENSAFQNTCNPWNLESVPGGSSGGSAAAVGSSEVALTVGSDTGGSIRQPASFCGIVGLKPTYGRVSRYGLVAFASSLDQIGPLARDVTDCALLLGVISGKDELDSTSVDHPVPDYLEYLIPELEGIKVGLPEEYFVAGIEKEVKDKVLQAARVMEDMGAEVKQTSLPHTEYAVATYYLIATAEASSNLARYDGVGYGHRAEGKTDMINMYRRTRKEGFGDEVKRRIMLGTYVLSEGYYEDYYGKAQKVRTLIRQDFEKAFQEFDVLLTPTSPTVAFKAGEKIDDPLKMYLSDIFTISANLAGIPGISIPCGFGRNNLPIGMQLLGKPFEEEMILRVAYGYEQNTEWRKRQPEL